jgi:5S rRNA maturation endonuclease (ribonuclease M5)
MFNEIVTQQTQQINSLNPSQDVHISQDTHIAPCLIPPGNRPPANLPKFLPYARFHRRRTLNSNQAKQIPLSRILERLGHTPHHEVRGELWYFSPFRKESNPSFKINQQRNIWNDYGEGVGGNVLDFIVYYDRRHKCQTSDVSFALDTLEELTGSYRLDHDTQTCDLFTPPAATTRSTNNSPLDVRKIQPLQNKALIEYLKGRGISEHTARPYVREIYYTRGEKHYFALAFPNNSGGYELRNLYFKGVHGSKDISVIGLKTDASEKKNEGVTEAVTVFEGFIDFLSALAHYSTKEATTPVIVLNSVAMKNKALHAIRDMKASKVYLYLDRDEAGRELTEHFRRELQGVDVLDKSDLYKGHKDFNDFLRANKKQPHFSFH